MITHAASGWIFREWNENKISFSFLDHYNILVLVLWKRRPIILVLVLILVTKITLIMPLWTTYCDPAQPSPAWSNLCKTDRCSCWFLSEFFPIQPTISFKTAHNLTYRILSTLFVILAPLLHTSPYLTPGWYLRQKPVGGSKAGGLPHPSLSLPHPFHSL